MKKVILVIDDDAQNILALKQILSPTYDVRVAKDGRDGINAALEDKPDLILLDIIMPEMDGYVALVELKSKEETKDIPVIFMSGLSEAIDVDRGLYLGAAEYITKPLSDGMVKTRIKNVLLLEGVKCTLT